MDNYFSITPKPRKSRPELKIPTLHLAHEKKLFQKIQTSSRYSKFPPQFVLRIAGSHLHDSARRGRNPGGCANKLARNRCYPQVNEEEHENAVLVTRGTGW